MVEVPASPNFAFLAVHSPRLVQVAAQAERYVFDDPVTALIKLRLFGELLAGQAAAHVALWTDPEEKQHELLRRLEDAGVLAREVADLFHGLRKAGNHAVHEGRGERRDALYHLRMARSLGIWLHRTFKDPKFKAGAFVPPPDPGQAEKALREELEELRKAQATYQKNVSALLETVQSTVQDAEAEARARAEAEEEARRAYQELAAAMDLAAETEAQAVAAKEVFQEQLAALQAQATKAPKKDVNAIIKKAQRAAKNLDLDEAATRKIIDAQLREAGWEADTVALSYKAGARPAKGRNMAISEWPTSRGPADYVLFMGLEVIGVIEAKRKSKDVSGAIEQSKRYSCAYTIRGDEVFLGGPWGKTGYKVPFLFATNGRPFLQQLRTSSGIWFLDARRDTHHARPIKGWYTPEGLKALLSQDVELAHDKLKAEPTQYLDLRDYQLEAIKKVEEGLEEGRQEMLLAMATGTGKTRTALGLIYRLIKTGRFRRVLFLVDRTSLGEQAHGAFANVKLENLQTFKDIYDVKQLADIAPAEETRLHFATVQGMVRRLVDASEGDEPVPVDRYDCIVIDECHRGYNLDQEMTEGEMRFRDQREYVSRYRSVIEHFDAVRIGLTATPALHTTEIFGAPIYEYSYRQAVIDGYLVDHEPPLRILTKLNQEGIRWKAGEVVEVLNTTKGEISSHETPDEIDIDVEGFNTKVITESFNRVVCKKLAEEIDPSLEAKTMIFCATDAHADMVVTLLKEAFVEAYGELDDDAVQKITGNADKPLEKIRRYKNEKLPNVAVTVDLMTTGIDVPAICNLVFIRRVKSRILYEQMLGRATRLCNEIGKETFRIFDAVDLYAALEPYTSMKPVVTKPSTTFAQLVEELAVAATDKAHQLQVLDELTAKLQRKKRGLKGEQLEAFKLLADAEPEAVIQLLKGKDPDKALVFLEGKEGLVKFLDQFQDKSGRNILISKHEDQYLETKSGYGEADKPQDYLESFKAFLEDNKNEIAALLVVTQRPRDLTRKELRQLALALDGEGYSLTKLRTAWRDVTNQDVAATLIGFIRQQALGSPLMPYEERVDRALARVMSSQAWSTPQKKWLARIGQQLKQETIVDREALDRGQFESFGGFKRLNKIFDGKLEHLLGEIQEEVWRDVV